MKKISTLIIILVAAILATNAQPVRAPQQVKERMSVAAQRMGQQKPNRITEEDMMAACPDSVVSWDTNGEGVLVPSFKSVYTYDAKKRIATETEYEWDDDEWEVLTKTTNTYEGDKLAYAMIEDSKDWFGTGLKKVSYTYDAAGHVTVELTQNVKSDGSLTDDYRHTYTYDAQGRLTEDLDENWDGDNWKNSRKNVTTYEGEKAFTTEYVWQGSQGWGATDYYVIYTNAAGQIYREDDYELDDETGEFAPTMVMELTFLSNGLPDLMTIKYDMGEGELMDMGTAKYEYEYNAKGLPTKVTTTTDINYFGLFQDTTVSVTRYYYGDGSHVDNAATEPVVTSRRFYGMDGKETNGASRGLYIVVTEYADGTRTTVKSVRK